MSDTVDFGAAGAPVPARPSRLDALREAIAEQRRLNTRLVWISQPENTVFELQFQIPTDAYDLEELGGRVADRIGEHPTPERVALWTSTEMIARYCVAIRRSGDKKPLYDASEERASIFAHPDVLEATGTTDSVQAVRALLGSDPVILEIGASYQMEISGGDADVERVQDPTAGA